MADVPRQITFFEREAIARLLRAISDLPDLGAIPDAEWNELQDAASILRGEVHVADYMVNKYGPPPVDAHLTITAE